MRERAREKRERCESSTAGTELLRGGATRVPSSKFHPLHPKLTTGHGPNESLCMVGICGKTVNRRSACLGIQYIAIPCYVSSPQGLTRQTWKPEMNNWVQTTMCTFTLGRYVSASSLLMSQLLLVYIGEIAFSFRMGRPVLSDQEFVVRPAWKWPVLR